MLTLTYKNEIGTVIMQGRAFSPLRITNIEGLGLPEREYNTVTYSGYDGQKTFGSQAQARTITIALEVTDKNAAPTIRRALDVFSIEGMLYIKDTDIDRRIKCNQVSLPDITRVLRKQISTFVIQLTCDSPFFEDATDTTVPLYSRKKLIYSDLSADPQITFSLPCTFGEITIGASVEIQGNISVEPIITMYYPSSLEGLENVTLTNETTGKSIKLDYAPLADDIITIDIKNRKITSSQNGNLINFLSLDTFLGDFVLKRGINIISVYAGDVTSGFTVECRYNNLYNEAVIV